MEENKNTKQNTSGIGVSLRSRRFRSGAFATLISVLVIAAVIGINFIVSVLGIRGDLTSNARYSLTDETKKFLGTFNDKITIYYLTKEGNSIAWLQTFFDEYQKESKNITVKNVDLLYNPEFAKKYTSEDVIQHSLIVVNETNGRSRYISYKNLLITEYQLDEYFNYTENIVGVDIEGQINSALRYVTTGEQTKFYALTGHGEATLGSEAQVFLQRSNIIYGEVELLKAGKVPEDCDILYIALPVTDYTDAELGAIREYTAAGGDILFLASYQESLKNFNAILNDYGMELLPGVIFEGSDKNHVANVPYCIFPNIIAHDITSVLPTGKYVTLPVSGAIWVSKKLPEELSVVSLLTTTNDSYLKVPDENGALTSQEKTAEDTAGPFRVGVYAKNNTTGSEMVVFSGPTMFADDFFKIDSYSNAELFANSVSFMAGAGEAFSVRKIMMDAEEMLVVNASQSMVIGIICILIIPLLLIAAGIVIVIVRRRR